MTDSPVFFDGANRQELNIAGGSIRLRWDFGDLALYSITGYESMDAYSRGDIDGGFGCGFCGVPNGPGFIPFPSETADAIPTLDQFTQEMRLESQLDGAFNWQAGVYYFDEDYDTEFFSYDSVFGGGAQNQYLRANQTNTAWAVFGSVIYKVHRAFELRAGVRYTDDEKDFVTGVPDGFTFPDPAAPTTASLSDDNVSWDLAARWSVTDAVNLYARVATGFRGASVQPAGPFGNQSVAEPETNTSYEVGVKADLWDRRAKLYFNLYHYEVKDQQLTAVGGANNAVRLLNADKTTGQGAELDFQAYVTPNLLVTLGASYNDTEINDDDILVGVCFACTVTDPIVLVPPPPAPPPTQTPFAVIDGNPLPQAPEVIANFTLRYGIPVGNGEFFALHRLGVSQRSEFLPLRVHRVHRQVAARGRTARGLQLERREVRSRGVRPQHHGRSGCHRRHRFQQSDRLRQRAADLGRAVQGEVLGGGLPIGGDLQLVRSRAQRDHKLLRCRPVSLDDLGEIAQPLRRVGGVIDGVRDSRFDIRNMGQHVAKLRTAERYGRVCLVLVDFVLVHQVSEQSPRALECLCDRVRSCHNYLGAARQGLQNRASRFLENRAVGV